VPTLPELCTGPLIPYGWDDRVAALFENVAAPGLEPARVVRVERSAVVVATAAGEGPARAADLLATGDWVAITSGSATTTPAVVARLPRWSELSRLDPQGAGVQVLVANIDVVLVVAPAERLSPARVERELSAAWESGATPAVVVTKTDLDPIAATTTTDDLRSRLFGVDVVATSTVTGAGLDEVAALLQPNRTAVLIGPSGAGKSSLTNALLGTDRMATGEVRSGDHRGRHTTTARQLLVVPAGGVMIDTPGIRSLGLTGGDAGVAAAFPDIEAKAAACRFRDCRHTTEPGCAVLAAVESGGLDAKRLDSYRKLELESAFEARRSDVRARQDQTRRWKVITRSMRHVPPKR
jgi:ribosome biogenesis GTPase